MESPRVIQYSRPLFPFTSRSSPRRISGNNRMQSSHMMFQPKCFFRYQAKLSPDSPIFSTITSVMNSMMNCLGQNIRSQFTGLAR